MVRNLSAPDRRKEKFSPHLARGADMFNSNLSFGKSANTSGDRLQPCKQMEEDPGDSSGLILAGFRLLQDSGHTESCTFAQYISHRLASFVLEPECCCISSGSSAMMGILTLPYKGLDASSDGYDDDNSLGSWFRPVHWVALSGCRDDNHGPGVVTKMTTMHFFARWCDQWDGTQKNRMRRSQLCAEAQSWYV